MILSGPGIPVKYAILKRFLYKNILVLLEKSMFGFVNIAQNSKNVKPAAMLRNYGPAPQRVRQYKPYEYKMQAFLKIINLRKQPICFIL